MIMIRSLADTDNNNSVLTSRCNLTWLCSQVGCQHFLLQRCKTAGFWCNVAVWPVGVSNEQRPQWRF